MMSLKTFSKFTQTNKHDKVTNPYAHTFRIRKYYKRAKEAFVNFGCLWRLRLIGNSNKSSENPKWIQFHLRNHRKTQKMSPELYSSCFLCGYIPLQPRLLLLLLFCKRVCTNVHAYICINMFMYMYYCKYVPELYRFCSLNFGTCHRFSWRRNE